MGSSAEAVAGSYVAQRPGTGAAAGRTLSYAAMLWFLTAVAGQWVFVYYIAAFYGPSAATGNFQNFDLNKGLTDGYVAGDMVGNLFFVAHVLLAAVLTFGGALQLVPQIRARAIAFHRWNGRIFMFAAIGAALGGLYLEWVRGTGLRAPTGLSSAFAITLNAILILAFAVLAWRAIRSRRVAMHQVWATRLFLVVNATWFMRVGVRAFLVLTGAGNATMFFSFWSFGASLFPLAVYELYRRAKAGAPAAQYTMAGSLVVLTVVMGIGTVAMLFRKWGPLIGM